MSSAPGCRRRSAVLLAAGVLALLAACGPEPTPLPVVPATAAASPEATTGLPADALAVDRLTLDLLPPGARERIEASVALIVAPGPLTDPGPAALSVLPFAGGQPSDYRLPVTMRLNSALDPLTDAAVAVALTAWLTAPDARPAEAAALRAALANTGYPDGVTLSLAAEPALRPLWAAWLDNGPVHWTPVAAGEDAHLTLAVGDKADALLASGGAALDGLPLYAAGWQVAAGEDGLPVLSRDG